MEKLIFLIVIVVITALHSWWKKKHGEPEEGDQPWPGQPQRPGQPPQRRPPGTAPRPAPPPKATNWQEELRRLLEGETAPRPQPAPPPVLAQPPPLPRPPRQQPAAPPPFLARTQIPVPDEGREQETGLPVKMPSLEQSAQAYLHARTLDARITERLKQVEQAVISHPKPQIRRETSAAVRHGLALLRDRPSQRAAIIASVILGPPKALEPLS
jgi:hypothetical protein